MSTQARRGDYYDDDGTDTKPRRFANSWAVVPMRLFLASVFLFAAYAKLTYPGFFDPNASFGFHSAVQSAKDAHTPLSSLMGPLASHTSTFGHITAFAELAIGLGLLVGLLTRVAAAGGMLFTGTIVLSINWPSVRQYTGNGGWFTSVDLAVIAALSVFVLGGAGPLSLDAGIGVLRCRRRARQDAMDPSFTNHAADLEDSRRRLRGDYSHGDEGPSANWGDSTRSWGEGSRAGESEYTSQLPGFFPPASHSPEDGSLWGDAQQSRERDNPR